MRPNIRAERIQLKGDMKVLPATPANDPRVVAFSANMKRFGVAFDNPAKPYGDFCGFFEKIKPYMPEELRGFANPASMFEQRGRFPEGSLPQAYEQRGKVVDAVLKVWLGLDFRSTFKGGMDGWGQTAGGLIVLNADNDYAHLLAVKGDPYNKGKIGVLGGQGTDADKGDTRRMALRESGEEIGTFSFDETRLFKLVSVREWRESDSRGRYLVTSDFEVYVANQAEIDAMKTSFDGHFEAKRQDPDEEVVGLKETPRREVLELIRDGQMGYYDQTQAFVMTALAFKNLDVARRQLLALGETSPTDETLWRTAVTHSEKEFARVTDNAQGDWRKRLDVDACMAPDAALRARLARADEIAREAIDFYRQWAQNPAPKLAGR
ncbi:MAG: hypothetical protein H6922_03615 [Pseudomonadaceae bacterium]|nr:hypothetical protein [Pseudomonadaceae bacterium]